MTTSLLSSPTDSRRKRRVPPALLLVLRHKNLVLWMTVLGSLVGFAISNFTPKVYYARASLQIAPDPPSGCFLSQPPRPPTLAERVFRRLDSRFDDDDK